MHPSLPPVRWKRCTDREAPQDALRRLPSHLWLVSEGLFHFGLPGGRDRVRRPAEAVIPDGNLYAIAQPSGKVGADEIFAPSIGPGLEMDLAR